MKYGEPRKVTPAERAKQAREARGIKRAQKKPKEVIKSIFLQPDYLKHMEELKRLAWNPVYPARKSAFKPGDRIVFDEHTHWGEGDLDKFVKPEPTEEFVDKWIRENT